MWTGKYWIDGKKIYMQTSTNSTAINMPYVDTVVKLEHISISGGFCYNNDIDNVNFSRPEFNTTTKNWEVRSAGNSSLVSRTIYYTKTTD